MDSIGKRSMNIKQIKVLAIVTICTILCHLLLALLSENFPLLNMNFFVVSDSNLISSLCSAFLYLPITLLLQLFIAGLNEDNESTFSKFLKEFDLKYKVVCSLFCLLHFILSIELSYEEYARCLFVTIYCGILSVFISMVMGYDKVDFAKSQYDQCSIGACWATGATQAYYEKSLGKFNDRLKNFEATNPNVKFFVKKLVLIAPLSCNVEGSLPDRGDEITHVGDLKPIECDQGANINRRLITPVYKISKDKEIFIAAEFPSPLGTLWGERHRMDKDVRIYIRDCFLKELKEQLKPYPVIILEYDDQNPSKTVPLHHFIVSSLQNYLKENNYYL